MRMRTLYPLSLHFFTFLLCLVPAPAFPYAAEQSEGAGWETCACKLHRSSGYLLKSDIDAAVNERKYARDREIDVRHVQLDLKPDFGKRSLAGRATLTFAPIAKPLRELRLDAVDLKIASVESSAEIQAWDPGKESLTITFAEAIAPDAETTVTVTYSAEPKDGWYYRTAAMGYPAGDDHFWTQGEPERHRHWFPGYDYPNERFTSEVICRVPKGMTVVSNGRLIEESQEGDLTLFHWKQEEEHVNYLISVVGGYFNKLESKHGELPLAFMTPPSEFAVAENSFRDTAAILSFFERETGVKYPWAKYYSVCVTDFIAGGMENTSVTTLTTQTLFSDETENLKSSHRLDAHEAAHQWFGDLVTCKDWSQIWLNEGFATYFTLLYEEEKSGRDEMNYGLILDGRNILSNPDEKPVVWRGYEDPMEQFDYRAYPKGSWVLHMIRSQIGPELFRKCIRTYLERHRNGSVETHDLIEVVEELSGQSWDRFFDQWVYHGGEPLLKVTYAWDELRMQAKLTVAQTQKTSDKVLTFDLPLPVRFLGKDGEMLERTLEISAASEDFYVSLPFKPEIVRIDPDLTVLAGIEFTPANPLLYSQLENQKDMTGRLVAAAILGGRTDGESISRLNSALNGDPFYGVRIEAAAALKKTHTPEALAALIESLPQEDARARKAVVDAIGSFFSAPALAAIEALVRTEKNPEILSSVLVALGNYPNENATSLLLESLDRTSYRHRIGSAAIQALRTRGDRSVVPVLLAHLTEKEALFTSSGFGAGLDALASLTRDSDEKARSDVRLFLTKYLDHAKETCRLSAIRALGTLADPAALGPLQTFANSGDPESPERKAATEAIRLLSAEKPQADEVKELRRDMLDLQKEWKSLRDNLETLKKQIEPSKAEK